MKLWPKDHVAVICGRVDDPYRRDVPGSKLTACWHCGGAVMICPVTAKLATAEKTTIICVECARGYYDESGRKMTVLPRTLGG